MEIRIRHAADNEFDKLADIYRREQLWDDAALVEKENQKFFQEIGSNRVVFFAEVDGLVVGAVQLVFKHAESDDLGNGEDVGHLHHLRVAKNFQGRGIAAHLHRELMNMAKSFGFRSITLEVGRDNAHAQEIYRHWGYDFLREGNIEEEIIMRLELFPNIVEKHDYRL